MSFKCLTVYRLLSVLIIATTVSLANHVKAQSRQLKQIGNGTALIAAWSSDGTQLAIGGSLGVWLYTPDLKPISHFGANDEEVNLLVWNPNRKQFATNGKASELQLWDAATGIVQTVEKAEANPISAISLAYSPDGSQIASVTGSADIHIWDAQSGKLVKTINTLGRLQSVAWQSDSAQLVVGGVDDQASALLQIWDVQAGKALRTFSRQEILAGAASCGVDSKDKLPAVQKVFWADNVISALFGEGPLGIFRWQLKTNQAVNLNDQQTDPSLCEHDSDLVISPDGNVSTTIRLVPRTDSSPGAELVINKANTTYRSDNFLSLLGQKSLETTRSLAWRSDNQTLALIDSEGNVYVYNIQNLTKPNGNSELAASFTLTGFNPIPTDATDFRWSQDGSQIIYNTYRYDGFALSQVVGVNVVDALSNKVVHTTKLALDIYSQTLNGWAIDPQNQFIALDLTEHDDNQRSITIYDLATGQPSPDWKAFDIVSAAAALGYQPNNFSYLSWSADRKFIAATLDIPTPTDFALLLVWEAKMGKLVTSTKAPAMETIRWDTQNQSVALVNQHIWRWLIPSGQPITDLAGQSVAWSPDSTQLAVVDDANMVKLYDAKTSAVTVALKSPAKSVMSAYSPNGKRLATADMDGAIRIWDPLTGKLLDTLTGHHHSVLWVDWKPDSSQLLSRGEDGTLRLWDVQP